VLQALEANGVRVVSVTVSRPSLDDVYLQHTGRSFTEAETAAAAEQAQRTQGKESRR
jgi:ABC-2 type transport system ATP-binding protein